MIELTNKILLYRFYECNIKGEESEKLCPDGLVFDIYTQNCDYPAKVDCSARPELRNFKNILNTWLLETNLSNLFHFQNQLSHRPIVHEPMDFFHFRLKILVKSFGIAEGVRIIFLVY